jgi:diamine N-acetyltransferase
MLSRIFRVEPPKNSPTVPLATSLSLSYSRLSSLPPPSILTERGFILAVVVRRSREEYPIHAEELEVMGGESVTLRPPREDDVEKVYEWDRDPELAAWNGRPPIKISLSAARRDYLARWEDPSNKVFIIEAGDEAIGMATLYDFRREGCEVGIKVGSKTSRGRGYASEAVELLVSYCFESLDLKVVRGSTLAHNQRMQRVFEKCGFKEVGDGAIISRFDNRRYTELFYERRQGS